MVARPDAEPLVVHVVRMKRRHVRAVSRIEQAVYPRPWSTSLFVSELALRASRTYLVARVGRDVVGYAGLMVASGEAHVTTIAVDPRLRRRGIATRLLVALTRDAMARGVTALTLEVRFTNRAAQELYRRFGFAPVGVRKNYYAELREDALVMWARDVDTPQYAELVEGIERRIEGETIVERPRWA